MDLDLEVLGSVAVHVPFHEHEAALLHEMQLAGLLVKALGTNEREGLIVCLGCLGIDITEVDVVRKMREVHDHVAVGAAFEALVQSVEVEGVGAEAAKQRVFAETPCEGVAADAAVERVSSPLLPLRMSAPVPPSRWSAAEPPNSVSSPPKPETLSPWSLEMAVGVSRKISPSKSTT
jgi:hypothetical protein